MVFGAKPLDTSGEKAKLDSQFYHQAEIMEGECFKCRDGFRKVFFPTDGTGHKNPADPCRSQPLGPIEDLFPVNDYIVALIISKFRLSDQPLDRIPDLRVLTIQQEL